MTQHNQTLNSCSDAVRRSVATADAYDGAMGQVLGPIRVEPLNATFGAVVHDVRLAGASDETIAELTELWLEYALLVFPGQYMTQPEQDEFARRFGELEFTASELTNIQRDGTLRPAEHDVSKSSRANQYWHHDSTYMPLQAKGAVFTAEIVPDDGGDTGFADMRAAYDALDDVTRQRIGKLAAYHSRRYSMDRAGLHVTEEEADRYQVYGFARASNRRFARWSKFTRRPGGRTSSSDSTPTRFPG